MSPKLVFYSDQIEEVTDAIDERLFSFLPASATIGYLPSSPDPERDWFQSREAFYSRYGARLSFFGLETEFDESRLDELFVSDAIHMTGGNTFRFLYWLRERGLVSRLREYVASGGVLVGVSAGAILMTPDVSTSFLCGDVEYPGLGDYSGLGLVDFAVLPHYTDSQVGVLERFSVAFGGDVYGVPDGGGIVVDGESVEVFGDCRVVTA